LNEKIKVPEGWEVRRLRDIAKRLTSGGTPSTKNPKYYGGNIPWLNTKEVKNCRIYKTEKYITEEGLKNSSAKWIEKNSVIVAMYGATAGKVAINKIPLTTNQACCCITLDERKANYNFVYYYLMNSFKSLVSLSSGAAQQNLNVRTIANFRIALPPLPEQQKIAEILGSIDDQIENLMEQNKTLEEMAETLFKEWIIKMDNENWDKRPLDKIAIFLNGLPCQKYPPKNDKDKLPVLKIKELQNGVNKNSDWASSKIPSEYIVQNGDVVFSWSGTLMVKIWNGEKCFLNQHLFKVFSKDYPKWFYYFWIKHYLKHFIAIAKSKATTMGHIKRKDLSKALIKVPSHEELKKMGKILSPMIEKIITNNRKIQTLTQLRDTLLPKLITGEIRVKV